MNVEFKISNLNNSVNLSVLSASLQILKIASSLAMTTNNKQQTIF